MRGTSPDEEHSGEPSNRCMPMSFPEFAGNVSPTQTTSIKKKKKKSLLTQNQSVFIATATILQEDP